MSQKELISLTHQYAQTLRENETFEQDCTRADQEATRAHDEHIRTHLRFMFEQETTKLKQQIEDAQTQLKQALSRTQALRL